MNKPPFEVPLTIEPEHELRFVGKSLLVCICVCVKGAEHPEEEEEEEEQK